LAPRSNQTDQPGLYVQQLLSPLFQSIVSDNLLVGEWGDADFTNINQWLKARAPCFRLYRLCKSV
jgi:hypothetical protein